MRWKRFAPTGALVVVLLWLRPVVAQDVQLDVKEKVLSNGMKVLVVERHHTPRISCRLVYRVGAVNDPAGLTGIAHLFEHMMFKGTKVIGCKDAAAEAPIIERIDELMGQIADLKRQGTPEALAKIDALRREYESELARERQLIDTDELTDLYQRHGATGLNAGTGTDLTVFMVNVPSNKLELFMWLDSDRMSNAVLREFYVERDVVADERRMRVDANPYGYFREEMLSVYFTAHPYGRPVGGWADDIQRITRQQAADFFATYYAPNNATLVLVGDLEPEATFAMAERYFGRVPRSPKPIADLITHEPTQHGPRRIEVSTMARPVVTINYHVPPRRHPDFYPLSIAADVLNGRSGRLHKRLVLADDIAFSVAANMDGSAHAGTFTLIAMPKGPNTHQRVEDTLVAEIDRLKSEPPTGDEMQRVKNAADAEFIGGLRSNDGLAMQLAVMDAIIDWREVIEAPAKIKAVTADQVAEVAKKYLIQDNSTVGWVTTKPMPAGQASPGGGAQ